MTPRTLNDSEIPEWDAPCEVIKPELERLLTWFIKSQYPNGKLSKRFVWDCGGENKIYVTAEKGIIKT